MAYRGIVGSGRGSRNNPVTGNPEYHTGVDILNETGTPIVASGPGTVVHVTESSRTFGYSITIDHGNGVTTSYSHNSENLVNVGDEVEAGQQIAKMGNTGRSTDPHLDYIIRVDGVPNPYYASREEDLTVDPLVHLP